MVIFIFYRILCVVLGIVLTTLGIVYLIIFSSLLSLGFSFSSYLRYVFSNNEIYLLIIGIGLITLSLFFDSKWKKFITYYKDRRKL